MTDADRIADLKAKLDEAEAEADFANEAEAVWHTRVEELQSKLAAAETRVIRQEDGAGGVSSVYEQQTPSNPAKASDAPAHIESTLAQAQRERDDWMHSYEGKEFDEREFQRRGIEIKALKDRLTRLEAAVRGLECPACQNAGWYEGRNYYTGEPEQIKCRFCDERKQTLAREQEQA